MVRSTGVGKKQWEHRLVVAVFAALLLSMLALAFALRPAWAIPGDPCPDCEPPVNNPPTVAANSGSVSIPEGQTALNSGTFSDPDNDPVTITASSGTVTKNATNGTWSWSFPTTDGPDQNRTVTITADDGTDTDTTSFSLTVNNVAPTVNLQSGSYSSVPEGGSFAKGYSSYGYNILVSDPGNDTWTVNTGCGANGSEWFESTTQVWCGFFDGPGSSTVSATATDSDGFISNTASVLVNVTNADPWAVLNAPTSINEGSSAAISLTNGGFVSPQDGETDTNAGFRYAFACNGGSLSTATYGNSGTANSTTCPTTDNGMKTVRGRIIDKDGGFSEYIKSVGVNNVAPTATFSAPASVNQGSNFTISLGSIADPSSADTLTYAFDCGDGSGYGTPISTPSTTCNAADKPTLTVKGKVMDDDGGLNEYTKSVNVNNVFPTGTIKINGGAPATNNAAVNLTLSSQDPLPGSDMGEMRFRNEDTATWSTWQRYATSRAWQLSSGDGTKTVNVEYKDNAGNVSQGVISDQILLDTTDFTAPTVLKWTPTTKRVSPTANVIATFSEKMYKASVEATNSNGLPTAFTLKKGAKQVAARVTYVETTTATGTTYKAILDPNRKLVAGATYTATVTPAATDFVGNPLVAKTWKFTVKS
jgi:hypothetical protein